MQSLALCLLLLLLRVAAVVAGVVVVVVASADSPHGDLPLVGKSTVGTVRTMSNVNRVRRGSEIKGEWGEAK